MFIIYYKLLFIAIKYDQYQSSNKKILLTLFIETIETICK